MLLVHAAYYAVHIVCVQHCSMEQSDSYFFTLAHVFFILNLQASLLKDAEKCAKF